MMRSKVSTQASFGVIKKQSEGLHAGGTRMLGVSTLQVAELLWQIPAFTFKCSGLFL